MRVCLLRMHLILCSVYHDCIPAVNLVPALKNVWTCRGACLTRATAPALATITLLCMVVTSAQSIQSVRLSLQSSELAPLRPLTSKQVLPSPPLVPGGTHSLSGKGAEGANADDGTDTLVL
jgi:hypothetical protein